MLMVKESLARRSEIMAPRLSTLVPTFPNGLADAGGALGFGAGILLITWPWPMPFLR
jgi:hypothetical protein